MNKTMTEYIKSVNDDELYDIFETVIHEMNKRKTAEVLEQQKAVRNDR